MNKVLYNIDQRNDTTDAQKTTARNNIGAASAVSLSEETARAIAAEVASATYDSENHLILFKNSANTQLFSLDATAFVMGGMIDSVVVEDGYLKITFITESGPETISVDIGDIFDANNYYTKTDTDLLLDAKQATVSTDTDESAFSGNTPIATGFSNNKVHLNTASRLWNWIKSQISSVLGLSENNGVKTYSGTADTADKVNYDTITSGNAYVPVFDHNGKRLKVVAGSRGLIMQKASDGAYALINCKSALAADADHAANADKVSNHTVGTDVPANAVFTDTTYQNKAAASGGTDASLVTTGEKYVWNNKANVSHTHDDRYYTETEIDAKLGGKVDKVSGKGLSTNDFTNAYKNNVDSNTSARHTHSNMSVLDDISSSDVANWNTHSVVGVEADSTTAFDASTPVVVGYNGTSKKLKTRLASALWTYIQGRISAVLGLTVESYGGKSALAGAADAAYYAQRIGTAESHPNVGNAYKAVHVNRSGVVTECAGYFVAGQDSNGNDARYTIVVGATGTDPNTIYFS